MKILIITNKLPYPPKDGGAIATFSLAYNLAEQAENVDILAINTSKHYYDVKKIPENITKKLKFIDFYLNTDVKLLDLLKNFIFSSVPYNAERFIKKDFEQKIIEQLSKENYDIIQMEGLYVLPYVAAIRKHSKALISYRSHNIEHQIWQRTVLQTKQLLKKIYLNNLSRRIKKFERKYINSYDLLVAITEQDNRKLIEMGNNKPSIVTPVGVDMDNYNTDNAEPEQNSIFHIGALDWSPNQEGLIWFIDNCWSEIHKQKPNLKFYIAGRNAPKWLISHFDKENIVYQGEVPDAHEFINSKSIMIVPLLSGSGMRVKIIEAMALSKTIITTSIGVEGIDAEDNKNIIIADKKNDFITKIISLCNNVYEVKRIGNNAKLFVSENFNNFAITDRLYHFYSKYLKIKE